MKLIFTLLISALISTAMDAQPVITITHNGKTKIVVKKEDEKKNVITIRRSDLNKAGSLIISYNRDKAWTEKISLEGMDTGDTALVSKPNKMGRGLLIIDNRVLKAGTMKATELRLINYRIPSDPNKAAMVRMRPLHVCTIKII